MGFKKFNPLLSVNHVANEWIRLIANIFNIASFIILKFATKTAWITALFDQSEAKFDQRNSCNCTCRWWTRKMLSSCHMTRYGQIKRFFMLSFFYHEEMKVRYWALNLSNVSVMIISFILMVNPKIFFHFWASACSFVDQLLGLANSEMIFFFF